MNLRNCSLLLALVPVVLAQNDPPRTAPAVFYVDAQGGQDSADGLTPATAWQSLKRVNRLPALRRAGVPARRRQPDHALPQHRTGPQPLHHPTGWRSRCHLIFCNSTEVCLRLDNDWRAGLTIDHNLWYQESKPLVRFLVAQFYGAAELDRYRREVGMDSHSVLAAPRFVAPAARDYRLTPDSPGHTLAHDGGVVGARPLE